MMIITVKAKLKNFNQRIELTAIDESGNVVNTNGYSVLDAEPSQAYNQFCADTNRMYVNVILKFVKG